MGESRILICGATSDLGVALIEELAADQGVKIVAVGRDTEKLTSLAKRFDCVESTFALDLASETDVKGLLKKYSAPELRFSGIACLAGRHEMKPLRAYSKTAFHLMFDSNFYSASNIVSNCGRAIAEGGSIVLVSSAATLRGGGAVGGYVATKSALEGFTKAAAIEFSSKNVRVNCVSPGVFESRMTMSFFDTVGEDAANKIRERHPLGCGTPSAVAGPILFLLSEQSRWITGQNIVVDGGYAINA